MLWKCLYDRLTIIQVAQILQISVELVSFLQPEEKSYQHRKKWKYRKKGVIHEVINVIHRKKAKIIGLHSKKREQRFCTQIIKLISLSKKGEKSLDFFKVKILRKLSENVKNVSKIYRRISSLDRARLKSDLDFVILMYIILKNKK